MSERRILALVLPNLLCEIAKDGLSPKVAYALQPQSRKLPRSRQLPLAVILDSHEEQTTLVAANEVARSYGVRSGQTVVEASALVSGLLVRHVTHEQIQNALERIAEMALLYGTTVSIESQGGVPDTVWVDITGLAHLRGGERSLAEDLAAQVRSLGYMARVAVASGKWLARALARYREPSHSAQVFIAAPANLTPSLLRLPLSSLPLDSEQLTWFVKVGVLTIDDFVKLPHKPTAARLGSRAERLFALCRGEDDEPLDAYHPRQMLVEERTWDEPLSGAEPLVFVLRGLTSRVSARLEGRGEAAQTLKLTILSDTSIAKLSNAPATVVCDFDLASPLWREREIHKVLTAKVERLKLRAPSVGMRLEVPDVTERAGRQLDFSHVNDGVFRGGSLEQLPILLAELSSEIGKQNVGMLGLRDAHRPEKKSVFVSASHEVSQSVNGQMNTEPRLKKALENSCSLSRMDIPTRLFSKPLRVQPPLKVGASLSIGYRLYSIKKLKFECRLDGVEWWAKPVGRDYLRLSLQGPTSSLSALAYVERGTGRCFIQAVFD